MSTEPRSGTSWGTLALIAALVLVVYVLSIGPAVVIAFRAEEALPVLEIVYAPLEWLVKSNDFLERLVERYILFWLEITDTPFPF